MTLKLPAELMINLCRCFSANNTFDITHRHTSLYTISVQATRALSNMVTYVPEPVSRMLPPCRTRRRTWILDGWRPCCDEQSCMLEQETGDRRQCQQGQKLMQMKGKQAPWRKTKKLIRTLIFNYIHSAG